MAEFKISRFRYTWKGVWAATTSYTKDDVVRHAGNSYVCMTGHTSAASFYTNSGNWTAMTKGAAWRGDWTNGQVYNIGDIVRQGGGTYICEIPGTANQWQTDAVNWNVYALTEYWRGDWSSLENYAVGDVVRASGILYKALINHTSTSNQKLETATLNWKVYAEGTDSFNLWTAGTPYKYNDLVKYGGSIWRANQTYPGTQTFDTTYWNIELYGYEFGGPWSNATVYQMGDVVRWGGDLYYSFINNNDVDPRLPSDSTITWVRLAKGYNLVGDWTSTTFYKPGDVVRRGGNLYVCLLEAGNDGSSLDYLDTSNWELLNPSISWRNNWATGITYQINDVVIYAGGAYQCALAHISDSQNYPGDNGSVIGIWEIYSAPGDHTAMRVFGDLVTYGLSREEAGDQSTRGPVRLPIGEEDKILAVDDVGEVYYKQYANLAQARYVNPLGQDREDYGSNPLFPYKTIRYACEQAEEISGNVKITVAAGLYEEVLPIILTAGVNIKGEEVRGVTVRPKAAIAALANDANYTKEVLTRMAAIIDSIITGSLINPTVGNTEVQDLSVSGSSLASAEIVNLINDIKNYIDFHINSTGAGATVTGSNTAKTSVGYLGAVNALTNNTEFLAAEAVAYMQLAHDNYVFDSENCKRDIRTYIKAWKYDIIYTGNYKSLLAARYYRNAVLGSSGEDMFYLRDATGIRNMSLTGLVGTLNPMGVFDFYQRPTGGSYCSFDPGWGPDDNRTWITTRSPYIQNCVTFGYAATGQKLDGSLHNGGNKSFVSNDFTQIISDGIGAHVLNGARAELVSVFTYYSQVGYLAESGGIIRSANGNNSYGVYGAMSVGIDTTEIPATARVNTRNHQAMVESVIPSSVDGSLFAIEFSNAGQNYTTASYNIVGAGSGISTVQEDFRDGAIFEALEISPGDSTTPGGTGYTNVVNNAASGNSTLIKININDPNNESEYLGMRIRILSGAGVGQYGYITSYDTITKNVNVYRESDGQPGWDHVLPGWPIESTLLPNTRYSIEPRVTFSDPTFISGSIALGVVARRSNIVYGETTRSWTGLSAGVGTGTVETQDGLTLITATWNVVKNGRFYTVTQNNVGAGYETDQVLTILGTSVGGVSPDNDITIRVVSVSNDSTNSITSFTYKGVGVSGVYVTTPQSGATALYSYDGDSWLQTTLPYSGEWNCLAAGNNMFVATRIGFGPGAYSYDGITWLGFSTAPLARNWESVAYGGGYWTMVSSVNNSCAYSTDGINWTMGSMSVGDSSFSAWQDVTYGKGKFFAIANNNNNGAFSTNGSTWTYVNADALEDSSQVDWVSCAYGNNRYVIISSQGNVGYSFDEDSWYNSTLPKQDGSTVMNWKSIRYGQGLFVAICDTTGVPVVGSDNTNGTTTYVATSPDGLRWTGRELASSQTWTAVAFGNPDVAAGDSTVRNNSGKWVAVSSDLSAIANYLTGGATARGRVIVTSGRITDVRLWDPGSGYTTEPTLTLVDPNNTSELYVTNRLGDGVLAQPSFISRGINYTVQTSIEVAGDGFADIIPNGKYITIDNLAHYPKLGAQMTFEGGTSIYSVSRLEELGDLNQDGKLAAALRITPSVTIEDFLTHSTDLTIRQKYSQCRISGHDFLDIGTGNFSETNYPELYGGNYFSAPENEAVEVNGGRVYYTSTDQNGNFRAGELFAVEQATGIVTISAEFFDFGGLSELRLGGVRIGGSGVVINEFSTDPLFSADSNNVIPTQRAIKTYLSSRLSVSGSDLVSNGITAGQIVLGGQTNQIGHANGASGTIVILPKVSVQGRNPTGGAAGIRGTMMAQSMFFNSFKDDGQL